MYASPSVNTDKHTTQLTYGAVIMPTCEDMNAYTHLMAAVVNLKVSG